jgi:hypothetical protein
MPLREFHGETFVSFVDISGFKALMKDAEKAYKALDKFYKIGYSSLGSDSNQNRHDKIEGLLISDCGILFSRFNGENHVNMHFQHHLSALSNLLNIIKRISEEMIESDLMITASIAYGKFDYHQRIDFSGLEKNFLLGNAYLDAYLDNEVGKPKLEPGQCRILINTQLNGFWEHIQNSNQDLFKKIRKKENNSKHLYFYWMVSDAHQIGDFDSAYDDTYNMKYRGMLDVLKQFSNQNHLNR